MWRDSPQQYIETVIVLVLELGQHERLEVVDNNEVCPTEPIPSARAKTIIDIQYLLAISNNALYHNVAKTKSACHISVMMFLLMYAQHKLQ